MCFSQKTDSVLISMKGNSLHDVLKMILCCYIYNGNIFPSLNPAKIFQFISRWTESTKSPAVGPNHMRSD